MGTPKHFPGGRKVLSVACPRAAPMPAMRGSNWWKVGVGGREADACRWQQTEPSCDFCLLPMSYSHVPRIKVKTLISNVKHDRERDNHLVAELQNLKPENVRPGFLTWWNCVILGNWLISLCLLFRHYESPLKYTSSGCLLYKPLVFYLIN